MGFMPRLVINSWFVRTTGWSVLALRTIESRRAYALARFELANTGGLSRLALRPYRQS